MIGALIGAIVAVVAAVAVIGVFVAVLGVVMAMLALAFKVLPFLLLGWLAVKLVRRVERPRRDGLSAADRKWLDSPSY